MQITKRLEALKLVKRLGKSYTAPFVVIAEDGNLYVTKPNTILREDLQLLAAESLTTELGLLLDIPVPDWAIIIIPEDFNTSESSAAEDMPHPGEYFGSRYLTNAMTLADYKRQGVIPRRPISNEADAPKCAAFDALIENVDRHENNIMLELKDHEVQVYLIDHGHVLGGPHWPALSNPTHSRFYRQRSPDTLAAAFGVDQSDMIEKAKSLCSSLTEKALNCLPHLMNLSSHIPAMWWNGRPNNTFTKFIRERAPYLHDLLD